MTGMALASESLERPAQGFGLELTGRVWEGYPKALRTHILWLLGPKTILCKAFGLF